MLPVRHPPREVRKIANCGVGSEGHGQLAQARDRDLQMRQSLQQRGMAPISQAISSTTSLSLLAVAISNGFARASLCGNHGVCLSRPG
jgi:hypothetical protein